MSHPAPLRHALRRTTGLLAVVGACAFGLPLPAAATTPSEPLLGQAGKDVIWLPTAQALVDQMLDLARLTPEDTLVDLGSGDGRTVITAAQRGARAHGIEYDANLVAVSQRAAREAQVSDRATFEKADIFEADFSKASVVTLFLLPEINLRLRPTLLDMAPGTRVVSNSFLMDDWAPDADVRVSDDCSSYCNAYLWIVPAKVAGTWKTSEGDTLVLEQVFQNVEGTLHRGTDTTPILDGKLDGNRLRFTAGPVRYIVDMDGEQLKGSYTPGDGANRPWSAQRESGAPVAAN